MRWIALALTMAFPPTSAVSQSPPQAPIVIANVSVLPMDRERVLAGQTVVVERGVISQMGPPRSVTIPAGAQTIDGTGKYLIPGLVDLHVHLASNPEDEQRAILTLFVANGVTTILNLRGTPQILELRTAIATGRVSGPTVYTAGPYVNEPFVTTPDEVERAVIDQKRARYDFVKLHGNLSRGAYARLNAVARREGIRVIGHAPRNLGVAAMFEERQYAVVHAEEFLYDKTNSSRDRDLPQVEARIPELARSMARTKTWLMPNLTAFKIIGWQVQDLDAVLARPEMRFMPRAVREGWGPATNPYTARLGKEKYSGILARYQLLEKLVRRFQGAGVRLLIGTDAMNTGVVPGFSAHDELEELVAAGLTTFEALRAATANAAEFLAAIDQRGVVAVGQTADLVLLDANPLENIANTRRIAGVLLRGQWLSRSDIARMLDELKSAGTQDRFGHAALFRGSPRVAPTSACGAAKCAGCRGHA
ncbi:MAG: amidohydrolase family protein [Gemmatimonadaceae bacterium]|nr:amidohydrolase family protein [Gemmatimonadaceae bacterium]